MMTYAEYFEKHDTENISWCRPFTDDNDHYVIMYDGDLLAIVAGGTRFWRYDGTLTDDVLESFARSVNHSYDSYAGYTDEDVALFAMREIGCCNCPLRGDCEVMNAEMEDD